MATKQVAPANYKIELTLGDKVYTSTGATLADAFAVLKKPEKIMLKGILRITKGKLKLEQLYYPVRLKRLFYNKYFQQIQAKQLESFLK